MKSKLSLSKNQRKGDWRKIDMVDLFKLLEREVHEMELAIEDGESRGKVIEECADVANISMMIADRANLEKDICK